MTPPVAVAVATRQPATWAAARERLGRLLDARTLVLGLTVAGALYVWWHLGRGWIPHDEGALAQSAERVLRGELPHRDFDEIYTGGLAYLNAAAFRLFGTSLFTMRIVLLAALAAWVPAVYYVASRVARPLVAAAVTALCVVWSVPNYPAPMPSWYNLFLATAGLAALCRWLEDGRSRWLLAAGLAGGLSLLVKVIGLYYVAGVLLFLVYAAHDRSRAAQPAGVAPARGVAYALTVSACLLTFCLALVLLAANQPRLAEVVHFVVPGALVSWLLIRNEWSQPAGASLPRFRALAGVLVPFVAGVAIPVAIFLVPYLRAHAVGALINGVFVLPTKRLGAMAIPMLSLWSMLALVPVWLLGRSGGRIAGRVRRAHVAAAVVAVVVLLLAAGRVPLVYRMAWYVGRSALPLLVLLAVVALARTAGADRPAAERARLLLLASVAGMCSLVQFPFAAPIYFCYVAPLVALFAVALFAPAVRRAPFVPAVLLAFATLFAVTRTNTSRLYGMGVLYLPYPPLVSLDMPRGGLAVPALDGMMYRRAIEVLGAHARGGYTWAAPDCPEIYFLSGLRNPTRTLFDDFDEPAGRTARILAATERHGVTAIVVNVAPSFADEVSGDLMAELQRRYPYAEDVGKFQVRWR